MDAAIDLSVTLEADPRNVARAREMLREALRSSRAEHLLDSSTLLSEVVTNAFVHVGSDIVLRIHSTSKVPQFKRLIVDLIDQENWSPSGTDLNGDAYEELLSKGASDKGSGAGQYFTPRELIRAIVAVIDLQPADTLVDPACGTGGFLLVAHEHASRDAASLTPTRRAHLRDDFVSGYELVDDPARLAAMNLLLHGIGTSNGDSRIDVRDSLIADPGQRWSAVLTNPPFGRKSSLTMVGADGRAVGRTATSSARTSSPRRATSSSTICSTS